MYKKHGKNYASYTAQKLRFSIKDFFSKCDQIHRKLRIWSHLLKKPLMENFNFGAWLRKDCHHKQKINGMYNEQL